MLNDTIFKKFYFEFKQQDISKTIIFKVIQSSKI